MSRLDVMAAVVYCLGGFRKVTCASVWGVVGVERLSFGEIATFKIVCRSAGIGMKN